VNVRGRDVEFVAQGRFDRKNATWTMEIVDYKIRYFVHVDRALDVEEKLSLSLSLSGVGLARMLRKRFILRGICVIRSVRHDAPS
jgi:hypothetical protein